MDYLLVMVGFILLIAGADSLVKGAARLAASIGIPSLVIGLTVVAFGTSAPELAVSIRSALDGQTEMAIANVVGSNIFNILFILGIAAIITPLIISQQLIRQDIPVMLGVTLLVFYQVQDMLISRWEATILVMLLVGYTAFLFIQGKRTEHLTAGNSIEPDDEIQQLTTGNHPAWQNIVWIIIGLVGLVLGAKLLVSGAVNIARAFAVSETIIGLTIIAIGTSLPEVVTSVVASMKGQRDIAVGNIVGSNIFNLLAVLGFAGILSGQGLSADAQLVQQDFPFMLFATLLCLPLFYTGAILNRIEGTVFFGLYIVYSVFLIATATGANWLPQFALIIKYAILPMTVLVALGSLIKDILERKKASK